VLSRVRLTATPMSALTIDPSGGDVIDRVIISGFDGVAVRDISSADAAPILLLPRSEPADRLRGALLAVQTLDGLDVYCGGSRVLRRFHIPLRLRSR
jgi:hypothetical protein